MRSWEVLLGVVFLSVAAGVASLAKKIRRACFL
jgi:hypothetical protein